MMQTRPDNIHENTLIKAVLRLLSFNSWLVLDLDNTVIEPHCELGSDQWFVKLINYACELIVDREEAIGMVIAIYHEVQHQLRMKAVEPSVVNIINRLQDIGIPVIGLTARGQVLEKTTTRQLNEIGINFHGNIIFCEGKDKGECLKQCLLQFDRLPGHIVMVDDKEKHLIHVKHAVESLGIPFNGLRYGFLDEKVNALEIEKAHAQLDHIKKRLPTSTQMMIERLNISTQYHPAHHKVDLTSFITPANSQSSESDSDDDIEDCAGESQYRPRFC